MKHLLLCVLAAGALNAATIAVIDSGVDVEHRDFVGKLWLNPSEVADNGRDEDNNGYQDDVYGWNFAENNNFVIDRKYLGTFSDDPKKFFEIQGKMFLGQATKEDIEWLKKKREDKEFIAEMGKFGNFVHGTHVAGITQQNNDQARILSVKLIPTEVKPFVQALVKDFESNMGQIKSNQADGWRMTLLLGALTKLAEQQMLLLEEIAFYVGQHKAEIANGSFGTGFGQAKMITDNLFKVFFFRSPNKEESDKVTRFFLNSLIKEGKKMVGSAKQTLFVFAAGNDGSNNDEYPTSPTNIDADNVISVAATYKYNFLAPFSNYGTKTVDVAAPGMLVHSQIPGNDYLDVSGTSQAAPYVSNIAAQIKDANPALAPKDIKAILMGTVDKKAWLSEKVKTQGIVNMERAVAAGEMTNRMSVNEAIQQSLATIDDVRVERNKAAGSRAFMIAPMPLPSLFR